MCVFIECLSRQLLTHLPRDQICRKDSLLSRTLFLLLPLLPLFVFSNSIQIIVSVCQKENLSLPFFPLSLSSLFSLGGRFPPRFRTLHQLIFQIPFSRIEGAKKADSSVSQSVSQPGQEQEK